MSFRKTGEEVVVAYFKVISRRALGGTTEDHENPSVCQDSRYTGQDSNQVHVRKVAAGVAVFS